MPDQKIAPAAPAPVIRDPVRDHLLTPQNAAFIFIDYQPSQVSAVASMDRRELVNNAVLLAQAAQLFGMPVVLTTVDVKNGHNLPTIAQLLAALPGAQAIDRTSMNAWEDPTFYQAVQATGRKKLIIAALWTEVCLSLPTLDALHDGFEVYPVVDAVGGTSLLAHDTALARMQQAGAQLTGWVQVFCELQRDWARSATAHAFSKLLFSVEGQ